MNGIGERTGNANLVSIIANLAAEARLRASSARAARAADRDRALRRRAAQPQPRPATSPTSGRNAFAHKGGMHVAGVRADAATFEHIDPTVVGNARELLVSELAGQAAPCSRRPQAPGSTLDDAAAARVVERVKELEHAGYQFEAADGSFELLLRKEAGDYEPLFRLESWRVHRRAARRRQGRDRGDDQDLGRRRALRAHRRGQRPGQRAGRARCAPRSARSTRTSRDIELVNFKVRILDETHGTDAVTRVLIDASDGARRLGLDRRARERHRRLVAGAGRLAGVRGCSRAPAEARARGERATPTSIPLARPVLGRARGAGGARGAALRPAVARARACRRSSSASPQRIGAPHASAVSSGTAGLHLALRAVGVQRGRRGRHVAVLVRRQRQRDRSSSARGRCSPTSTRSR